MIRLAALAVMLVLGISGGAQAQAPRPGAADIAPGNLSHSDPRSRKEQVGQYRIWCDGADSLMECVERVIWLDQELREREALAMQTGRQDAVDKDMFLVGCYNYCMLHYFPAETPQECRTSMATFRRASRARPALLRSSVKRHLDQACGRSQSGRAPG